MSITCSALCLGTLELAAQHLVEAVVVLEVVARDRAGQAHDLNRRPDILRELVTGDLEDPRQPGRPRRP